MRRFSGPERDRPNGVRLSSVWGASGLHRRCGGWLHFTLHCDNAADACNCLCFLHVLATSSTMSLGWGTVLSMRGREDVRCFDVVPCVNRYDFDKDIVVCMND